MDYEYDSVDIKHAEILKGITVMSRSNKYGFKEEWTDRLDSIRELLKDSDWHEILLPHTQIWRKDMDAPIDVIVSSHADVVDSITKCHSTLTEHGYLKGTYDNAGTNAAAVIAMLEGDIPDNVIFAFTADEETGRCSGAKQTLEYVRNQDYEPVCIALDVTWEGYHEGNIFSIENLSSGHKKNEDDVFLNRVAEAALAVEPDGIKTFSFTKIAKDIIPSRLPKEYIEKGTGMFDEACAYVEKHARAFSLCLPCIGGMHDNYGITIRQPGFEGYINTLEAISYQLALGRNERISDLIAAKQIENATLSERIVSLIKEEEEIRKKEQEGKRKLYSNGYSVKDCGYQYNIYDYYDDCDYPEFGAVCHDLSPDDPIHDILDTLYEGCMEYEGDKGGYIEAAIGYIEGCEDEYGENPIMKRYETETLINFLGSIYDDVFGVEEKEEYEEDDSFYVAQKRAEGHTDTDGDYIAYDVADDFDDLD